MCVTSPPYYGLRDYGHAEQIGAERTPAKYVQNMVDVFRKVRDVLADDGTLWLNLGDSYATRGKREGNSGMKRGRGRDGSASSKAYTPTPNGFKNKDLMMIPARVAIALQEDGWWLRSDNIWAKSNGMPESVTDRTTRAHEYVFMLAKSEKYYFNGAAVRTPLAPSSIERLRQNVEDQTGSDRANGASRPNRPMKAVKFGGNKGGAEHGSASRTKSGNDWNADEAVGANLRDVWWLPTKPFKEAHFAVMPVALAELCVLAGSQPGDTVLDPFSGAGTTGVAALSHGRNYVGVELNPEYVELSRRRLSDVNPALGL